MTVKKGFNRSLLSLAIAAVTSLSVSNASAAQCSGSPASEGGDVAISTGQGETCTAVTVSATPDGDGRVGNVTVEGTIQDSSGSAALIIDASDPFPGSEPNVGNILNSGSIISADVGIEMGDYDQRAMGIIGNIINAGNIQTEDNGIDVTLGGNGQVGIVENRNTIQSSDSRGMIISLYGTSSVESVVNTGSIQSGDDDDAMVIFARENSSVGSVTNSGDIQAGDWGLVVHANYSQDTGTAQIGNVTNTGTISATDDALYVFAYRGTIGDVLNSGTLIAQQDHGLYIRSDAVGTVGTVTNSGSVSSATDAAVRFEGGSHTFINTGTITGTTSFSGTDNTFILAGGQLNGDVEAAKTMRVTGDVELTGNILGVQPYYTNISGVLYVDYNSEAEYDAFIADATASALTITDTGRLQIGAGGNVSYQIDLNQQGALAVALGSENHLQNQSPTARLSLESQVIRKGDDKSFELVTVTTPKATFEDGSSLLVTPDYRGDFAYGDTEQYRVLSAVGGITGTPTIASSSILYTAVDAGASDGTNIDVTVSTTDLSSAVEASTNDATVTLVAGFLESYLGNLEQGAAADFIENEQLLAISDVDGLVDYLKQQYPNTDTSALAAVIAATEQMQGEVFSNVLAHLASLRNGGRSGVAAGDLVEEGGVWLKAIASEADQGRQSSNGVSFNGYKSRLSGFSLGGDIDLNDTYTVGSSFSYASADVNVKNSSSSSDIESYQVSLYSNWQGGDWFVDSVLNVGLNNTDSTSYTGSVKGSADYSSKQYGLLVTGGKELWFNNSDTLVEPRVSLEYSQLETESYTQTFSDGSNPVRVKSDDFNVQELGAGVRLSHLLDLDGGILLPEASFMVYHDFAGDSVDSTLTAEVFNQSLTLRSIGVDPEQTSYMAGVGFDYWTDDHLSLSLNYEHRWASGFKSDSLQAKIRYDF